MAGKTSKNPRWSVRLTRTPVGFQRWLPSPFTIAVMLTALAGCLALRTGHAP